MRELPLNSLRALALVHAHGGVRAAARELGVAHSAVSRHLAELERWLGVGLLRSGRGRGGVVLTPQALALAEATLTAMTGISRATAAVRERASRHAVTLSAAPSVAARWLLPRLTALESAHPQLEVSLVVDQRLDDLRAAGIDLAIRMGDGRWPDVHCDPLMDDALYPVMGRAYWEEAGRPRRPEALRDLRLLHDRDPQASWQLWRQAHGPADLDVRRGPRYTSSDLVLRAAAQGLGVALARQRLAADDVASGALVRPFGQLAVRLDTSYWLVRPRAAPEHAATRAVVAWLHRQAQEPATGSARP